MWMASFIEGLHNHAFADVRLVADREQRRRAIGMLQDDLFEYGPMNNAGTR